MFIFQNAQSQDVVWANKVIFQTERFETEHNFSELLLGPPTIYPSNELEVKDHDPYAEGYLIYYDKAKKKDVVRVSFPKPVNARQIVLGGVFNIGTINQIAIINKEGKERIVYKLDRKESKTKFKTFYAFFSLATVYGVRLTLDHSRASEWNVIKGIGISKLDKPYEIIPKIIADSLYPNKKIAVSDQVNSADCYEFSPKLSPDGNIMYFVKECPDKPDQEIFYTERLDSNAWSDAKNVGAPLNNKSHNYVASVSVDGNSLLIGNRYKPDGSEGGPGVSVSYKNDDGSWSLPTNLDIPNAENQNDFSNYYMSSDETALLMALENKNSQGGQDIYVSLFNKYKMAWSDPINLGAIINTPFDEDYPYLASDNTTLYFSSKGYLGYGGHDIMMSKRLDDTWKRWSEPVNLGPSVNTKADDKGFVIANTGREAFFNSASFASDKHHMDIYKIDLPMNLYQNPRILYNGIIMDEKTKQPILARISYRDSTGEKELGHAMTDPKTGKFSLSIPFGKNYTLKVDAVNYFQYSEKLSLTNTDAPLKVMKDITIAPFLDSGQVFTIRNILFETGMATLKEESFIELDKLLSVLNQQNKSIVEIDGHTDNIGEEIKNKNLSNERAHSVVTYLISKGIRDWRLRYKGYGETVPIASNDTPDGRQLNRRVEFKILEKDITDRQKKRQQNQLNKKPVSSRFKTSAQIKKEKEEKAALKK